MSRYDAIFPVWRAVLPVFAMSVIRFLIALVQMAGLIAYFHHHLAWGLVLTAIVALVLAMLVPIAATIFGFMGAIYVWSWPWWLAFLVFLPGLAMALTALAGVGLLGVISAFLVKRLGIKIPTRGPSTQSGHVPPNSSTQGTPGRGDTIEGEVISSRVDADGK